MTSGDERQHVRRLGRAGAPRGPLVIVAAAGMLLSISVCWHLRMLETSNIQDQFEALSAQRLEAIRHGVSRKVFALEAIRAIFDASTDVNRDEFAAGAAPHLERNADIRMLAWAPRITAEDRVKFETLARGDGIEKFQFVDWTEHRVLTRSEYREEYFPIYYTEPYIGNEADLGWCLTSCEDCAADMVVAGDMNRAVLTAGILPSLANSETPVFVMFMPVYRQGGLMYSADERRKNLKGFLIGVFRFEALFTEAFALLSAGDSAIDIDLSLVNVSGRQTPLYHYSPGPAAGVVVGGSGSRSDVDLQWTGNLDVCERRWLVRCSAGPDFVRPLFTTIPWWVLAVGLFITTILTTWVSALLGQSARVREQVEQRTQALRESEERLREAAHVADAATRAKSEFLANMSHEIRTPMTAILGFADVLLESGNLDDAPPERIQAAQTIKRNGEYLLNIINDILDLSKVEAGKMVLERTVCDPCRIVADVASLMKVKADASGLAFDIEFTGEIPETITTDATHLRQILINLIGNAVKFTELGGVRLIISLIRDRARACLQFDVLDTGIGMTREQLDHLFQPFAQADASTTRRFGGTGLGLTISKRFAEVLGGDIVIIDTSEGVGTRVRLVIDAGSLDGVRMVKAPRLQTCVENAPDEPKPAFAGLTGCRILLAEDGPDNQRLIAHVLQKAGAEVTIRENGQLAVEAALAAQEANEPFDVILMDMQMPVMDGYEATRMLRRKGYGRPIIALTAHAMEGDRQKCIEAGCDDYATKPVNRANLIETVQRIIHSSTAAQAS